MKPQNKLKQLLASYEMAKEELVEATEAVVKAENTQRIFKGELEECRKKIQQELADNKLRGFVGETLEVSFSKQKKMIYDDVQIIQHALSSGFDDIIKIEIRKSVIKECIDLGIEIPGISYTDEENLVIAPLKKQNNWEDLK